MLRVRYKGCKKKKEKLFLLCAISVMDLKAVFSLFLMIDD